MYFGYFIVFNEFVEYLWNLYFFFMNIFFVGGYFIIYLNGIFNLEREFFVEDVRVIEFVLLL